jgi:FkbM family methyltransferase
VASNRVNKAYLGLKHQIKLAVFHQLLRVLSRLFVFEFYDHQHRYIRNQILKRQDGVLHIGGSFGQEAQEYADYGLKVIWIEGLPEVFLNLEQNISRYPNQRAFNALLGGNSGIAKFILTSNGFMSSSLYRLNPIVAAQYDYKELDSVELNLVRLDELFPPDILVGISHWVIDVQGAELEVLKGAGALLRYCSTLEVECSNYEVYKSAALLQSIEEFLNEAGFIRLLAVPPRFHGDIIFVRSCEALESDLLT